MAAPALALVAIVDGDVGGYPGLGWRRSIDTSWLEERCDVVVRYGVSRSAKVARVGSSELSKTKVVSSQGRSIQLELEWQVEQLFLLLV